MTDPGFRGPGSFYGNRGKPRGRRRENYEQDQPSQKHSVQVLLRKPDTLQINTSEDATASSDQFAPPPQPSASIVPAPATRRTIDTSLLQTLTGGGRGAVEREREYGREKQGERRRDEPRREERGERGAPSSGRTPQPSAAGGGESYGKEALGGIKVMRDAVRLLNDSGELQHDFLAQDFISDINTDFRVIAAVGPQTTGKSTILSMLAGNQPLDLFRQYVFRPSSREAVETSKHQTAKISVYVSKHRNIFIDCQATDCASILVEHLGAVPRRDRMRAPGEAGWQMRMESLQLLAWVLQVSHTVLVCHDWFIDIDLIRLIRTAVLFRAAIVDIAANLQLPELNVRRRTNLVFVHTRARFDDFAAAVRTDRAETLKRLFGLEQDNAETNKSKQEKPACPKRNRALRVKFAEQDWEDELGAPVSPPCTTVYFPLAEMKLREMSASGYPQLRDDERDRRSHGSVLSPRVDRQQGGHGYSNAGVPLRGATTCQRDDSIPSFDEGIVQLKKVVMNVKVDPFTDRPQDALTERQWYCFSRAVWQDATFRQTCTSFERFKHQTPSAPSSSAISAVNPSANRFAAPLESAVDQLSIAEQGPQSTPYNPDDDW